MPGGRMGAVGAKPAAASATSYADEVLADSPLGYWPLTDPSGTNADDAGPTGNDGTYDGSPSLASRSLSAALGSVADFDGSYDRCVIPYNAAVMGAWGPTATIEAWVIFDSISGNRFIAESGPHGSDSPAIYFWRQNASGNMFVGWRNGGTYRDFTFAWTPTTGVLYHVAATIDGTNVKFIVNGVQQGSSVAQVGSPPVGAVSTSLFIGCASPINEMFDGAIGHVAIYDSALSLTRLAAHYIAGTS